MTDTDNRRPITDVLTQKTFERFRGFIEGEMGIKMPETKKTMLQSRLLKRMRKLGIETFDQYCDHVFSPEGLKNELHAMMDVVTTNKTDFFREPKHFDYLVRTALPELISRKGLNRPYKIWSSACSTGEEPYTLAMVLSDFIARHPGFHFSIMATDISTKVLKEATLGIYDEEKTVPMPPGMRTRYLLRSKDRSRRTVRVIPELRAMVRFRWINLMHDDLGIRETMDIVFCRNVIIYFDRPTQEAVLNRLCNHLEPGGYMFMGHSETLNGLNAPLVPVYPTVYQRSP